MKEIKLKDLEISIFHEKLKNGLEVYLVPLKYKKKYYLSYATRFGADIVKFTPKDLKEEVKVPYGVAHFLEHKLFEQEDGKDPFTFYAESGAEANASTSYEFTKYICSGTKNYENNLDYLIKYVNTPYFTDQNVKKEKGIIIEELKMYLDIPECVLENKIKENTYHVLPRKVDVGGTIKDVKKIKKEDLYKCYSAFYQPCNMFIIGVGNIDVSKTMEIIHNNFDDVNTYKLPEIKKYEEEETVVKQEEVITMDIKTPKVALAYKTKISDFKIKDSVKLNYYINLFLLIVFGNASDFMEEVRTNNLVSDLYTEVETVDKYITIYFYATTSKSEEYLITLDKYIKNITINDNDFERYKKVWIANLVRSYDSVNATMNNVFTDILKHKKIIDDRCEIIKKLEKGELEKVINNININNSSKVVILPK